MLAREFKKKAEIECYARTHLESRSLVLKIFY